METPTEKVMVIPLRLHIASEKTTWQIGFQDGQDFRHSSEVINLASYDTLRLLAASIMYKDRPISTTIQTAFSKLFKFMPSHIFPQPICHPVNSKNELFIYYPHVVLINPVHHQKIYWLTTDQVLIIIKNSTPSNTRLTIKHIITKHLLINSPATQKISRKITGEETPRSSLSPLDLATS